VALNGVTFDVPENSVFGLLGPNGAGKTSLIRIINQITAADSGRILFKGSTLDRSHISGIGYLPEERGLYKKMTVLDQIVYFARLKDILADEARNHANAWLERFDIQSWRQKKIEELSKGMQQKVQFCLYVLELTAGLQEFVGSYMHISNTKLWQANLLLI
jgi:ABC-2 type transport system ATP-binding protein